MKFGWPISVFLHVVFIGGSLLTFSRTETLDAESRVIPVELLTLSDMTNVRASLKAKTPAEISPEPVPMELQTPMENSDEEGAAQKRSEESAPPKPPERKNDDVADVAEPPKTDTKEPAFDLDAISNLIDKNRDAQPEKNQQRTLQSEKNLYAFAETAREAQGLGTELSLSELDALQSAMYRCWRIPLDAKNPEELIVRVRVSLRSDGHVQSVDVLDRAAISMSSNPYLKIAAQRAVSAVSKCAPYDFLPVDKYDRWKEMTLRFKPEV